MSISEIHDLTTSNLWVDEKGMPKIFLQPLGFKLDIQNELKAHWLCLLINEEVFNDRNLTGTVISATVSVKEAEGKQERK